MRKAPGLWIDPVYYHLDKPCRYVRLSVYFLVSAHLLSLLSRDQHDEDSTVGYLLCARPYTRDIHVTWSIVRTLHPRLASWASLYYSVHIMISSSYDTLSPIPTSHTHRWIQTRRSCRISTHLLQLKPARTVEMAARSFDSSPLESTLTSHFLMATIGNIFHGDVSAIYCLSVGSTMRVPGYGHTRIYQAA